MDNRNHKTPQHSQRNKALLGVGKTRVYKRERGTEEHFCGVSEVESVGLQIARALRVIPSKSYRHNVYTQCGDVKSAVEEP